MWGLSRDVVLQDGDDSLWVRPWGTRRGRTAAGRDPWPTMLRVADYVSALISAASGLSGAGLGVYGSLKVAGRTAQAARQREAETWLRQKAAEVYERLLAEILHFQATRRHTMRRRAFGDTALGPGNGIDELPEPEQPDDVFQYETAVRIYGNEDVLAAVRAVKEAEAEAHRLFLVWSVAVSVGPEYAAEAANGRSLEEARVDAWLAAARADKAVDALQDAIRAALGHNGSSPTATG